MSKKKIFIGAGAIVLAIGSVFATTEKPRSTTAYYRTGGNTCRTLIAELSSSFFSTSGTNAATIKTTGGTNATIFLNNDCTGTVYFTND